MISVGERLRQTLSAVGVDAIYGPPVPGLLTAPVSDVEVALLLAAAHKRVHGTLAAVHVGDGRFVLDPPARTDELVVASVDDLEAITASSAFRLAVDLDAPAAERAPERPTPPHRWLDFDVTRLERAESPVALVGPAVLSGAAVAELHALAVAANLGVLNTWGAKGIFDWRSRHHLATVGLQELDFQLGGLATADVIVAIGIDPDEAPRARWELGPVVEIPTGALGPLSEVWSRPAAELTMPPLRDRLAAVTQQGWAATGPLLAPSRVTLHYGQCLAGGGMVAADAGLAGYWVARTFATTELGSAQVPSVARPGYAVACALVARLRRPWRPVVAVVDAPAPDAVDRVLDAAASLGVAVPLEVWDPDGERLDADAHFDRLGRLTTTSRPARVSVATDPAQLTAMLDAAGKITAWGGLSS